MNCLIIEDEPLAADVLKEYMQQISTLKLVAICPEVFSAMEILHKENIDLIFLDINLPKMNGLEFLKTINRKPHVILTTAYHQHALASYEFNVVDYLLKPIEFSRFLQAINKVFEKQVISTNQTNKGSESKEFFFFNVDKKQVKVLTNEIIYIESLKDYVRIHTNTQKLVTKYQIGEIEDLLNKNIFIRIHKSYIINKEKLVAYSAADVELGNEILLPIGRSYKAEVGNIFKM
ncbi:MAG: LytTR family DNA-binding domain-containing protein [Bacteroidia bacterium]